MMLILEKKNFWKIGLCVAVLSFIAFAISMNVFSAMELHINNYFGYMVFSLIAGVVAAIFIYFRFKIAFLTFAVGLIMGFSLMLRAFSSELSGWEDLVGVMNLMLWSTLGLGVGLLIQLGTYLYKRLKKKI
jgi:hypothetical protein